MELFERPFGDPSALATVGSPAHRAVARQAVRESMVLDPILEQADAILAAWLPV
jgi:hypothetical protein